MNAPKAFAKGLYDAAFAQDSSVALLDKLSGDFKKMGSTLSASKELRMVLAHPAVTQGEKEKVLEEIAKKLELTPLFRGFLAVLAQKSGFSSFNETQNAFFAVCLEAAGGTLGRVQSADPLGDEDIQSLVQAFSKKLGKKVQFQVATDPSLLAGLKVTVNGITYDGTLSSQLKRLREQFVYGSH